jgi:hypothetical protein
LIIIQHRVNEVEMLLKTPSHFGVEVDIRSNDVELYLAHDPFVPGQSFRKFLDSYDHSLIVLNVKEEGLEDRCIELLEAKGIQDYFFLDQSMPFLIKRGLNGAKDGACRASEYESLATVENLKLFCDWVWADSFESGPESVERLKKLSSFGLKICVVSPELHGMRRSTEIDILQTAIHDSKVQIHAVCTKFPEKWAEL